MPSLERTAYPRFGRVITAQELERASHQESGRDRPFALSRIRRTSGRCPPTGVFLNFGASWEEAGEVRREREAVQILLGRTSGA